MRAEEGSASGHFYCRDDSWHSDDQEEFDHQEDVDCFDCSLTGCEEEDYHQEGRTLAVPFRIDVSFRIGFTCADPLI